MKLLRELMRAPIDPNDVIKALEDTGSINKAAKIVGVTHSTLRLRFPELIASYKRVSPTSPEDPRDLDKIIAAAADPYYGIKKLAKDVRISASTIQKICKRYGIEWKTKRRDKGLIRKTYRGKPTGRYLEALGEIAPAPETQLPDRQEMP
jgi:DNA invertase Pin-like site-specific DNA recombinase